jgi:hypothetical protein
VAGSGSLQVGSGKPDASDVPEREHPVAAVQAFRFAAGSQYGPTDCTAVGGAGAAVVGCERDGVDLANAVRAGRERGCAARSASLRWRSALRPKPPRRSCAGPGSLHELCPPEAVTGQYAASALRAAVDGWWGHQIWCDVTSQVVPEHRARPTVDRSAFIDPQAFVAPDVVVDPNAYVGGGAVMLPDA